MKFRFCLKEMNYSFTVKKDFCSYPETTFF